MTTSCRRAARLVEHAVALCRSDVPSGDSANEERSAVVPALISRLQGLIEWVEALAAAGAPDLDGLLAAFRSASAHVTQHTPEFEAALA